MSDTNNAPDGGAENTAATSESEETGRSPIAIEQQADLLIVTFDVPGQSVNTFSMGTVEAFEAAVSDLEQRCKAPEIHGVLFRSGKPGTFIAGAELSDFGKLQTIADAEAACARGHALFDRIEALPVPTAAAINGTCVGGGLEFAMSCTFRVAEADRDSSAKIGLPEIKLGIVPAWGGTQRLPRWVGLSRALKMITAGQLVDFKRAKGWGLLDALVPVGSVETEAKRLIGEAVAAGMPSSRTRPFRPRGRWGKRRPPRSWTEWLLTSNLLGRCLLFFLARRAINALTGGHYPAPIEAVNCLATGANWGEKAGFAAERKAGAKLLQSDLSRNLVSLFFLTERIKKDCGVEDYQGEVISVDQLGVLGAGVMGGGIAQIAAYKNVAVRMRDLNQAALDTGMAEIARLFDGAVKRRKLDRRQRTNRQSLISTTLELTGFGRCDLVVEAVVEKLDVKRAVLADVEKHVGPRAILATNTSSLSVDAMAEALQRPERLVGLHFFNPVHKMPLVEIVRGRQTADEVVVAAVALAKRLGKTPIVVGDAPGFLVNRILMPLMDEAAALLLEGFDPVAIDGILRDFGLAMGAFELLDTVGIDVAAKVAHTFADAFGERVGPPTLLDSLVEAGHLGRKAGKGFYSGRDRHSGVHPALWNLLPAEARAQRRPKPEDVVDRIILRMLAEAVRTLDEGVARSAADVDAAMIFGTGFAPFRGGLLRYGDARGLSAVVARLDELAKAHEGPRFAVPDSLRAAAGEGRALRDDIA